MAIHTENIGMLGELLANKNPYKSWHRYTMSNSPNTSGKVISIEKVDPERCIVISERLRNTTDQQLLYDYTLTADQLTVSHQTLSGTDQLRLGFTIIELY